MAAPNPTPSASTPTLWQEAGWILVKDLRAEGRTLAVVGIAALLALGVVAACALAGLQASRSPLATAAIWVGMAFAGVQAASGAYEREQATGTLTLLLCGPVRSLALFLGKTMGIVLFTVAGALTAVLLASLLLHPGALTTFPVRLLLIVLAGGFGFSMVGGLVAPLLGLGAGRDALLALLLLPLGVPIVVAGARATQALYQSLPALDVYRDALGIVVGLDALYLVGALWLFEPLVRRGH